MAAHTGIEDLNRDGVRVRNFGLTPVTRVTVKAEAHLDEDGGPDVGWLTIALVPATATPRKKDLLPAGETVHFVFNWQDPPDDPALRWQSPDVKVEYTDAAGTRWSRKNFNLPVRVGGTPLPGSARETRRAKWRSRRQRLRQRRRNVWRSLRLGFRNKGFTKKGRSKRRDKEREKRERAKQTGQD
ncbi:hypothetical protein ACIQAC_10785 [Streptomyces sp. NPDC088387]|uniref:hypothetical protein n=1 Tax=Streptomyces sp. NPDC088387 TaxID=3365859 RepID=UPI0037FA65DC